MKKGYAFILLFCMVPALVFGQLGTDTILLPEATIDAYAAAKLVKAAVRNFPNNYSQPCAQQAFYRQTHTQDGYYVRLIEAQMQVLTGEKNSKVAIDLVRRSNVFESNGDQHDDHLMDLLKENWLYYRQGTVFDTNSFAWSFSFDTMQLDFPKKSICFKLVKTNSPIHYSGTITLNLLDTAVLEVNCSMKANPFYTKGPFSTGSNNWQLLAGGMRITYQLDSSQQYYTAALSKWYSHQVTDHPYPGEWQVSEYFDLWLDAPVSSGLPEDDYHTFSNLYHRKYRYDAHQWQTISLKHPLPDGISTGLSKWVSLERQFEKEGI